MAKNKEKEQNGGGTGEPENQHALVLFGGPQTILPKELADLGFTEEMVKAEEIPGVAPTWKPLVKGDFLLGRAVDVREGLGKFASTCVVFETAVPGGFRSVWLGADLKIKLRNPVGKVYSIYYDGEMVIGKNPQPMKQYRVFEVQTAAAELPANTGMRNVTDGR